MGDDKMDGGLGNDRIRGGDGVDTINGGEGDDVISGGFGNDIMDGGAGMDKFRFGALSGQDTINNFVDGEDKIDLSALGLTANLDPLLLPDEIVITGEVITVTTAPDLQITLTGFAGTLTIDDFII
jgi:Ca2+-binding RTX toxin-like protein